MTADLDWVGPFRGPCGLCGGPDARHRTADGVLDRIAAGADRAEVAADYEIDEDLIPTTCENPVMVERERWEDLLGSIWLYIEWRYVTKQLTTEQKNLFADAVDASSKRLNDPDDLDPGVNRWWVR